MALHTGIQSVKQLENEVFGTVNLGDPRRTARLLQVVTECLKYPGATFGQIFKSWKDIKGAYRLIENPRIAGQDLFEPLQQSGARACSGQSKIYAVQDTTGLDFSHRQPVKGLGPVNTKAAPGQGLFLHSTLGLAEDGTPLGFLGIQTWSRKSSELGKRAQRKSKPVEEKESSKWLKGMEQAQAHLESLPVSTRPRVIHVMDREGDIFEVFEKAFALGHGVVIRAAWNRNVAGEHAHLWETMQRQPVGGRLPVEVRNQANHAPRTAQLEIRWGFVVLQPPRSRAKGKSPIGVYAVWAVEVNAPEGVTPVEWMILTTEPVHDLEGAVEILRIYRSRWRVEDIHLILKSGCRMEKGQFESRETIEKMLAVNMLSALRILILRYLAETQPDGTADQVLDDVEQEALRVYIRKYFDHDLGQHMTVGEVRFWIGRIGGHLGRKRDGMPGIRTLWRGWRDFELLVSMYTALHPT